MGRRRSASSVTDLLSDIVDDIKDFLDDEVIDRVRDQERDVRRSGRRFADGRRTDGELDDLRDALRTLNGRVATLLAERTEATPKVEAPQAAPAKAESAAVEPAGEPWPGYDDLTVAQIRDELVGRGARTTAQVRAYEQANKKRRGVLALTDPA